MFIMIQTLRNESVVINLKRVLFCSEGKKGSLIAMEDGSIFETSLSAEAVYALIKANLSCAD